MPLLNLTCYIQNTHIQAQFLFNWLTFFWITTPGYTGLKRYTFEDCCGILLQAVCPFCFKTKASE